MPNWTYGLRNKVLSSLLRRQTRMSYFVNRHTKNSCTTSAGVLECFLWFSYLVSIIPKPPRVKPDIIMFIIPIIMGIAEELCNVLFFIPLSIMHEADFLSTPTRAKEKGARHVGAPDGLSLNSEFFYRLLQRRANSDSIISRSFCPRPLYSTNSSGDHSESARSCFSILLGLLSS